MGGGWRTGQRMAESVQRSALWYKEGKLSQRLPHNKASTRPKGGMTAGGDG